MVLEVQDNEAKAPEYRVAFGIGSWNFGLRYGRISVLSLNEYVSLLKEGLLAVSALNNLEILRLDDEDTELNASYLKDTGAGPAIFPGQNLTNIKFDLYIPFRIQEDLAWSSASSQTKTESFRVHVLYSYEGPVCFVELVDDENSCNPSIAVKVVREYLDKQLNGPQGKLAFTFVGPSPFHADFLVEGYGTPNQTDGSFDNQILHLPGYADVRFRCCIKDFPTAEEGCGALFEELSAELGLFYEVHRSDVQKHKDWRGIEGIFTNLTGKPTSTRWSRRLRAMFLRGRHLQVLRTSLAKFEADQILDEHYMNSARRNVYDENSPAFLRKYLDSTLQDRPIFPTKQIEELIKFIERRRSKSIELLTTLLAALVGGLVGGLFVLLAT